MWVVLEPDIVCELLEGRRVGFFAKVKYVI
jgi:hypothetical protein